PVDSEGARLIIREAMKEDARPLFVTFMGPLTDLASAYLLEPRIAGRLTAIWIGGGCYPSGGIEFNLGNDIHAANVVFASKIELWQVPKNVYEMMPVSLAKLEYRVHPQGEIGQYLFDQLLAHTQEDIPRKSAFRTGETWVLGDNPSIGLILYEHRFAFTYRSAPQISQDMGYLHTGINRPIRVYESIDSRLILEDMYCKIALFAQKKAL
ncbi:MAG: nucleoside hydrolase, partial [Ruthenibacterium sp.]